MTKHSGRFQVRPSIRVGSAFVAAVLFHLAGTNPAFAQAKQPNNLPPAGAGLGSLGAPKPHANPAGLLGGPGAKNKSSQDADPARVTVDDNMIVDLHVNDEDLGTVLEMLSIQSKKNIIASKNVNARVSANLYGVTFYEALDAILNINGYGYLENGNFITIYTLDELKALQQAQRQRISKVIHLNYLSSTDAAALVTPLLSVAGPNGEAGQIKTNGKLANFPTLGDVPQGNEEYANTSMLVVYDYEENVNEIEQLLKQLDTRPAQVLVEATILQTALTEANGLGIDFSIIADSKFTEFVSAGGPLGVVNGLIRGATTAGGSNPLPADSHAVGVTSTNGNTASSGGFKVGVVSDDVAVFLRVLDEVTDTTILSNPKIMALNRQASRVLVGRKVGYLSTTSTDTTTTQTVQFLDTGTQLYFRPIVMNDGMIRMELKPQVSDAVIRDTKDATGAAVTIPDENTNELTTNVMLRDGQTVVLGGLFREQTQSSRNQVPFLGDIPLIGAAFRGHDDSTERNEIIFMITPHIVNDSQLADAGQRGRDQLERAVAGAREGTLFWSRDKMSSQLNVEADDEAAKGDTDKALWLLQRSLAINPNQPEAIGLREKLSTEKTVWPTRSTLQRIIDGETANYIKTTVHANATESPETSFTRSAQNSGTNTDETFNPGEPASTNPAQNTNTASTATYHVQPAANTDANTPSTQTAAANTDASNAPAGVAGLGNFRFAMLRQWVQMSKAKPAQTPMQTFTNAPDMPTTPEVTPVPAPDFNK
ncbi:MAG: hypothetical protein GC200_11635 [Tepidisphaera sp.]|nr:hypothetical protein [Tepidisphaera sp.]